MHFLILSSNNQDFRSLKSLTKILLKNKQYLTTVAVTGTHLTSESDGLKPFEEEKIPIDLKLPNVSDSEGFYEPLKLGVLIPQLAGFFAFKKPDALIVSGDSVETLSAVISAYLSKIAVVHLQGGEKTLDSYENNIRYAISRLSSLHFVATKEAQNRLKATGEPIERIFVVGAPEIDALLSEKISPPSVIESKFYVKTDNYILLIQHPESGKSNEASRQITQTLAALREFKHPVIAIEPEKNPGSNTIVTAIKSEAKKLSYFKTYKTLDRADFLGLLRNCRFLLGNSSLGIVEAATFGRMVVNIGDRQKGREHAYNVIDVPFQAKAIVEAINKITDRLIKRAQSVKNIYGEGKAGEKIFEILNTTKFNDDLINKKLNF